MKARIYGIISALLLSSAACGGAAAETGPLALEACIQRAFRNNRAVAITEKEISGSKAALRSARSVFMPRLFFESSYSRIDRLSQFTIPLGTTVRDITIGTHNNYSASAGIQYPLYTWGRNFLTYDLARESLDMTRAMTLRERRVLYDRAVRAFYNLLLQQKVVKIQEDNLQKAVELKKLAQARYDAGVVMKLDALNAGLRKTQAQNSLASAREAKIRARLNLEHVIRTGMDSGLTIDGSFRTGMPEINEESILRNAVRERTEVKLLELQEAFGETRRRLAEAELRPGVYLNAGYSFRNGYMPDVDKTLSNWNAGVTVSFPLFDGMSSKYRAQAEQINLEKLSVQKEETKDRITLEIREYVSTLRELEKSLLLSEESIRQADESARVALVQYRAGTASMTDVLNADANLLGVRLGDLRIRFLFTIALYDLEKAACEYPEIVQNSRGDGE